MKPNGARVLMASSVHRWNDVRIYHKEAQSLAKFADVRLVAVQNRESSQVPNGGVAVEFLPVNGFQPGNGESIFLRLKRIGMVMKNVLNGKYDVFHFHDPELIPIGWLAKLKGKHVIYDIHEDYPVQILSKLWIHKFLRKPLSTLFLWLENFSAKRVHFLITAGPLLKERFIKINPMTEVLHNYPLCHELNIQTAWKEKRREICFIGNITRIRGLKQVVQALENIEGVTLNLAGNCFSQEFREELLKCKGWEQVREWGWADRQTVANIMAISKIGVVTFLPLPNHIDLRSNKMFEYMSAGIPVIASNFQSWKKVIDKHNCGICVDPENPDEIVKAIKFLLENDRIAKEMGENGRKAVESIYNWENEEIILNEIYQCILSDCSSPYTPPEGYQPRKYFTSQGRAPTI